jgi:hypothetical protein
MFGFGYPQAGGFFEATYRAFPLAFIDKQSAEYGDKVILPPSALSRLGGWQQRRVVMRAPRMHRDLVLPVAWCRLLGSAQPTDPWRCSLVQHAALSCLGGPAAAPAWWLYRPKRMHGARPATCPPAPPRRTARTPPVLCCSLAAHRVPHAFQGGEHSHRTQHPLQRAGVHCSGRARVPPTLGGWRRPAPPGAPLQLLHRCCPTQRRLLQPGCTAGRG